MSFLPKHWTDRSSSSAHVWYPGTHRDAKAHTKGNQSPHERATRPRMSAKSASAEIDSAERAATDADGHAEGAAGAAPACACGGRRLRTSEGDLHDARPQRAHGGRRVSMFRVAQAELALAVGAKALDRPVD